MSQLTSLPHVLVSVPYVSSAVPPNFDLQRSHHSSEVVRDREVDCSAAGSGASAEKPALPAPAAAEAALHFEEVSTAEDSHKNLLTREEVGGR